MKNKLLLKKLFSNIVVPVKKINFIIRLKSKNRIIQFTSLIITAFAGFVGTLLFTNYIVYTLLPSVWHWGFDSTITWENSTIHWKRLISIICSPYLIIVGLFPLFLRSYFIYTISSLLTNNFENHYKKIIRQFRPCLLSIE